MHCSLPCDSCLVQLLLRPHPGESHLEVQAGRGSWEGHHGGGGVDRHVHSALDWVQHSGEEGLFGGEESGYDIKIRQPDNVSE